MGPLRQKTLSEREEEVKEEYLKTLQDLTFNSKPLIDVLTEVADENREYAACIVDCIEEQLENVSGPLKLPILYLIDSIIKCETIKQYYLPLFCRNIHKLFTKVYDLGDDNVKNKLAKLRFTWNGVLPAETLLALDNMVRSVNPGWQAVPPPAVHVNPKFIPVGVAAVNVAKINAKPTKEELRQKQKELLELTQRKQELEQELKQKEFMELKQRQQELEQELKVLRPIKTKTGECKTTEKLINAVNQLFTQVEQVKSGTYNPLEVQRVRESAGSLKNSMQKVIECVRHDQRYAALAKDSPILNELVSKLTETEKVLTELEKSNQCNKRKVILVEKPKVAETSVGYPQATSTNSVLPRSNLAARNWNKSSPNQYVFINKANGSLTAQPQTPQSTPAFRIAPVSTQLINAAAKRARDPRLQKIASVPVQKKPQPQPPSTSETAAVVNGRRETAAESAPRIVESKSDKRNESPEKSVVVETVASKKTEPSGAKSKSASNKNSSSADTASTREEKLQCAKKRKVEKVVEKSESSSPKPETSHRVEETNTTRKRKAEAENGDEKRKLESESPSPEKRKSNGGSATRRKLEKAKKSKSSAASSMSAAIDELFEDAPKKDEHKEANVSKTFSKEERYKRLRILVRTPTEETERLLETLAKRSPKMAEKFIRLLNKEKDTLKKTAVVDVDAEDSSNESEPKSPPSKESEAEPEDMDMDGDVDCVIVSSPKPAEVVEKMKSPPRADSLEAYDPITDLPEPEESTLLKDEPKDEPKIEPAPSQDVDLRSLIAPTSVMMPPVSASVIMPTTACKSPPTAPPPSIFPFMVPGIPTSYGMLPTTVVDVPKVNEKVLEMIDGDPNTTINIDTIPREIRHYGSTAVVFINWDEPRQILFMSDNAPRRVVIDGKYTISCMLNAPDVESLIYGKPHRFRLGAPTRELYIDGMGYECYFGGAPIKVHFDGRYHSVRLEGKLPKADIGQKRLDLVAGRITLCVNDKLNFSVFLDAKPQKIEIEGEKFVFTFIDSLQRVLINDIPFRTDFGGFPQSFRHYNKIYSFRFGPLPRGIVPGAVNIYEMRTSKLPPPPPLPPSLRYSASEDFPVLPVPPMMSNVPVIPVSTIPASVIMSSREPSTATVTDSDPSTTSPAVKDEDSNSEALSIDELVQKLLAKGLVSLPEPTTTTPPSTTQPSPPPSSATTKATKSETNSVKDEPVKPVDLKRPETLKQKQPGMISMLYTGNQCGSCGLRFPEEQTLKYSEHLDWHFRLNRRGRDGARTIHSRKWYYHSNDWLKFQEMEDESDRGQSWFDNHPATEYTEEEIEQVPCIKASRNGQESCELCRDRFEQFYNEESDEWQLRNAIKVDDKIYHPICYQDHTDRCDQSDDVEEIVDMTEPINVDDPSVCESDNLGTDVDDLPKSIKQEKPDAPKVFENGNEKSEPTLEPERNSTKDDKEEEEEDEDSDVEVQVIEQPIEEIIIPDDANDLEESNLETLVVEDIIASQTLGTEEDAVVVETSVEELSENVVDITQSVSTVSIDGNIEPGDSVQQVALGASTKIKINIAKNHTEIEKTNAIEETGESSPKNKGECVKSAKVDDFSESSDVNEEPPPPGEERITAVPADLKPRLRERKLTEYPPVKKGVGDSSLCSIM